MGRQQSVSAFGQPVSESGKLGLNIFTLTRHPQQIRGISSYEDRWDTWGRKGLVMTAVMIILPSVDFKGKPWESMP